MVRSHLDYCSSVWALHRKLGKGPEKSNKNSTRTENLPYSDRLKICKIPTLHYRRIRGDMTETYKIDSGKYQPDVAPMSYKSSVHVTRGNDIRLENSRVKYDLQKFSFSNRVVNIWNSSPNWVVSANTTGNRTLRTQDTSVPRHFGVFWTLRHGCRSVRTVRPQDTSAPRHFGTSEWTVRH